MDWLRSLKAIAARRYASAVYAVGVCPSVCLSVCLTQADTVPKLPKNAKHRITQKTR